MRKIIKVERFVVMINALPGDFSRLDEALSAVDEALCKTPETFPVVIGTEFHRLKLRPFEGVPALSIFYRYDAEKVYLLWAELCTEEE